MVPPSHVQAPLPLPILYTHIPTGCQKRLLRRDVAAHARACAKRPSPCPNAGCGASPIRLDEVAAHRLACPCEWVCCPFEHVGCVTRMLRQDVVAHEDAAAKQHNRLLLAALQVCRTR